jgi:hypothetical protein
MNPANLPYALDVNTVIGGMIGDVNGASAPDRAKTLEWQDESKPEKFTPWNNFAADEVYCLRKTNSTICHERL